MTNKVKRRTKDDPCRVLHKASGYIYCYWYEGGKQVAVREHRLVWERAYGEIPRGYSIHHINEDKTDNRLENLEMVSHQAHSVHHNPVVHWTRPRELKPTKTGRRNRMKMKSRREYSRELVLGVLQGVLDGRPLAELRRRYGIHDDTIKKMARFFGVR